MLECVVNLSEGRDADAVRAIAACAGAELLDIHSDPAHNRSVLTLAGPDVEDAARAVAAGAVVRLDLTTHTGVHPRFGVVDVVPFVPLPDARWRGSDLDLSAAMAARERFGAWAAAELALPCFRYGPERSLPELRRTAFTALAPDFGPARPHPSAGACAVGVRPPLVAYNVWLDTSDVSLARSIAAAIRSPTVRALGFDLSGRAQVSCNLIEPLRTGPADVYDEVERLADAAGVRVERAELVGLAPAAVVDAAPARRRRRLDLSEDRTIEARLRRPPR